MSLVNQMLRDLHERRAHDNRPLTGLHAVSTGSEAQPAGAGYGWVVAVSLAAAAVAVAMLWRMPGSTGDEPPQPGTAVVAASVPAALQPQPDVQDPPEPAAIAEYPSFANLGMNRLDYDLRTRPRPMTRNRESARPEPAAASKTGRADVPKRSVAKEDAPDVAVRQAVAPTVRLRRDGLAALRAGRAVAAGKLFAQFVDADPGNPEAHLFLHAALQAQSRDSEAQSALLRGLGQTSEPARLAQVLAHDMLAEDRVDDALAILTTYRPYDSEDLQYEALLAAVNQRAGHHAVAAGLYQMLIAERPANGDWWVGLAISQEAQGFVDQAAKSFATASAAGTLDIRLARYAAQRLERLEQGS